MLVGGVGVRPRHLLPPLLDILIASKRLGRAMQNVRIDTIYTNADLQAFRKRVSLMHMILDQNSLVLSLKRWPYLQDAESFLSDGHCLRPCDVLLRPCRAQAIFATSFQASIAIVPLHSPVSEFLTPSIVTVRTGD